MIRRRPAVPISRRRRPQPLRALRPRYCATCAGPVDPAPVARRGRLYCSFTCALAA